jgi:hypothetical protein
MLIVAVMVYPMAVPNKLEYCTSPQMNTCLGPAPDTIIHKPYEAKVPKNTIAGHPTSGFKNNGIIVKLVHQLLSVT